MPRGSPFTALCQTARFARRVAADLHAHTTASDGDFTPDQLVAAAAAAGLSAVAVTDHDTTAGVGPAHAAADRLAGRRVTVVPGVEVSTVFDGREYHLLGLFVRPDDPALAAALAGICDGRRERFRGFVAGIPELRPAADAGLTRLTEESAASLGRRHVAGLLVRAGVVKTRNAAFQRFLGPVARTLPPKPLMPLEDAIRLVRGAGGVASLAHPGPHVDEPTLAAFRDMGLNAVEATFPAGTAGRSAELRAIASRLGLAVTGGSDWHGPDVAGRAVGCRGLSPDEWAALRAVAAAGSG